MATGAVFGFVARLLGSAFAISGVLAAVADGAVTRSTAATCSAEVGVEDVDFPDAARGDFASAGGVLAAFAPAGVADLEAAVVGLRGVVGWGEGFESEVRRVGIAEVLV